MPLSPAEKIQQKYANPSNKLNQFAIDAQSKLRFDPGVQARTAIQAPESLPGFDEKQLAFEDKLTEYGDWSKSITENLRRASLARRAKDAAFTGNRGGGGGGYGPVQPSGAYANYKAPTNSRVRQAIVSSALSMLGTPYALGGGGFGSRTGRGISGASKGVIGVDCSGLTSFSYGVVGIRLPRYSNNQTSFGVRTSIANAQPGDIVGWARGGHVAIYIGNGMIVESPKPGKTVRVRRLGANEQAFAVRITLPGD